MTEHDIDEACRTLSDAFRDNSDHKAILTLSTQDLLALQTKINETLIGRFKPLHKAIQSLIELETNDFNKHIKA